jgi:dimethylargininase
MIVASLRNTLRRDVGQASQSAFRAVAGGVRSVTVSSPKQACLLHTFAISREIPKSFEDALSFHSQISDPISMDTCLEQHALYLKKLRNHIPTLCLPGLESNPDCVFVEDCAVTIGNRAVVTNLGHLSRRGEADSIKEILIQLGMDVTDMRDASNQAICDGGDVLYTGRHLFVGLSSRTNSASARVLQEAFDMEVVVVPSAIQGDEVLHLKSAVTHLDERTLFAPTGASGDAVLEAMEARERGYDVVRLPDMLACNVVAVNGWIMAQDTKCQESRQKIEKAVQERNLQLEWVDTSELAKKDAALTCCSLLISL